MLDEFYRIAFRKKLYDTIESLQADLDLWMREFNETRPHQGKWCFGKTPMQTFLDALPETSTLCAPRPVPTCGLRPGSGRTPRLARARAPATG
jgi:hypothetical protein